MNERGVWLPAEIMLLMDVMDHLVERYKGILDPKAIDIVMRADRAFDRGWEMGKA